MKLLAVRNLRLCTKDCLCLYVCPVGATDTEDSVIDAAKCTGCGVCAQACPSKAISMVPLEYPPQQEKGAAVLAANRTLARSKATQEQAARQIAQAAGSESLFRLATAVAKSNRLMAEDILRESGYMLPQSGNAHALLRALAADPPGPSFPKEAVHRLLQLISTNDSLAGEPSQQPERWRCRVCGHIHEGSLPTDFLCPVCKQPASSFERI